MKTPDKSTLNGMVTAIGLLVLALGTATGNAYVMLVMALAALVAVAIFGKRSFSWPLVFGGIVAMMVAFAFAFKFTKF